MTTLQVWKEAFKQARRDGTIGWQDAVLPLCLLAALSPWWWLNAVGAGVMIAWFGHIISRWGWNREAEKWAETMVVMRRIVDHERKERIEITDALSRRIAVIEGYRPRLTDVDVKHPEPEQPCPKGEHE